MTRTPLWIRASLRLLPPGFRERFGADLAGAAESLSHDARRAGGRTRQLRYVVGELTSFARLALALRRQPMRVEPNRAGPGLAISTTLADLRWALRYSRRRPLFALTVTATLAITIAAATAAFGLAAAVLWRALPFTDASRLVFVWEEVERDGQPHPSRVTGARYAAWRGTATGFASMALFGAAGFTIEGPAGAESIRGVRVSANYFETLGIRAALGRTFAPGDDVPGSHRVVILSQGFWLERLGARPEAIGERISLSGESYTIVGVMPPVTFPAWPVNPAIVTLDAGARQFWVPIPRTPALDSSARAHVFGVLGRLAPGVEPTDAAERLNRTADAAAADPHRARLTPLRRQFVADARTPLLALAGAMLALMLIACANLAALYVSVFEARRREFAIRAAIGAGVLRLVRQLAIEAALVASTGAAVSVLLTRAALAALPRFVPPSIPLLTRPAADGPVLAVAAGLALLGGALLTAWPVTRLVVTSPSPRGLAARSRDGVYRVLVVSQVAVTLALAAAAALLAQSLHAVRSQPLGFAIDRVFVADVGLPASRPADPRALARAEVGLLAAIAARPNVSAVAAAYDHPLEANWSEAPAVTGEATGAADRRQAELRIVSPGYFEALDVELLDGRTLTERDALGAPGAAVVNEAFAREIGERAIGRRIRTDTPRLVNAAAPADFEIVGVVNNERFRGLEHPGQAAFYLSTRQFPQATFSILARTAGDPLAIAPDVRAAVRAVDSAITVDRPTSLDRILRGQLLARRLTSDLIGALATAALALAALGVYGLLAASVGRRRREIGVRLAVGASPAEIAFRVVGESLRTVATGIAIGCALALAVGRLVQNMLVGVSPNDPATLAAVAALLLTVAVCAALIPARRAARVDPVEALRAE